MNPNKHPLWISGLIILAPLQLLSHYVVRCLGFNVGEPFAFLVATYVGWFGAFLVIWLDKKKIVEGG